MLHTISPLLYVSKILGLAPFKITKSELKLSKINSLWSLSVFFIATIFSAATFIWDPISSLYDPTQGNDFIEEITDTLEAYLSSIAMSICLCFSFVNRKKIVKTINNIEKYEQRIPRNTFKTHDKSNQYKVIFAIVCIYIIFGIYVYLEMINFDNEESIFQIITYVSPTLITSTVILQFCTLILFMRKRFAAMNNYFEDQCNYWQSTSGRSFENSKFAPTKRTNPEKYMHGILEKHTEFIRKYHYILCDNCEDLNRAFLPQLLFVLVQSLISFISITFYLVSEFISDSENMDFTMYLYTIILCGIYATQIMSIIVVSILTSNEANRTAKIMFKREFHVLRSKEFEHEIYFSAQMIHQNVKIEICKGYPITGSLLSKILGSITTYLLIVIQFKVNSHDSKAASSKNTN